MSKQFGKRPCPAKGETITSSECGSSRNRLFVCPADCPFNPFALANYERLMEIESKLDRASLVWLHSIAATPQALLQQLSRLYASGDPVALHSFIAVRLFHERDDAGLSAGERFLESRDHGLSNDQQALLRSRCGMRVTLLEVHRVIDHERIEAVDLLAPEAGRFLIIDRSLARMAVRYTTVLAWRYELPHFQRFCGVAITVPEIVDLDPDAVVREISRHLGGPESGPELLGWLALNFVRVQASINAIHAVLHYDMLSSVDARRGVAVYNLRRPLALCFEHLIQLIEWAPGELTDGEFKEGFLDALDCLEAPAEGKIANSILGRLLVGDDRWRLEANGGERFARLRCTFESHMGDLVEFAGERFDDLAAGIARPVSQEQLALVPPGLRLQPTQIELTTTRIVDTENSPAQIAAAAHEEFLRIYPDVAVPALGGLTPRQAATDPRHRPTLLRLLKGQVRSFDEENLRQGTSGDMDWLLRELDASELILPPPPLRLPSELNGPTSAVDDVLDGRGGQYS